MSQECMPIGGGGDITLIACCIIIITHVLHMHFGRSTSKYAGHCCLWKLFELLSN